MSDSSIKPEALTSRSTAVGQLTAALITLLERLNCCSIPEVQELYTAETLSPQRIQKSLQDIKDRLQQIRDDRDAAIWFVVRHDQLPPMVLFADLPPGPPEDSFEIRIALRDRLVDNVLAGRNGQIDADTTTRCDDFLRSTFLTPPASYHALLIDAAAAALNDLAVAGDLEALDDSAREWLNVFGLLAATGGRLSKHLEKEKSLATASALSHLNFGIDGLEFVAGVADLHLPIDAALSLVDVRGPSRDFLP